jgi:uncharacterized damage-inducible protein DinB
MKPYKFDDSGSRQLRSFRDEPSDLKRGIEIGIDIGEVLKLADYWFDGLIYELGCSGTNSTGPGTDTRGQPRAGSHFPISEKPGSPGSIRTLAITGNFPATISEEQKLQTSHLTKEGIPMREHLLELTDYHFWATRKILEHIAGLPDPVYRQPLVSIFPSLAEVVKHLYDVDQNWLSRMHPGYRKAAGDLDSVSGAMDAFAALRKEMAGFLKTQDPESMIRYRNSKGAEFANRLEEIIHHMVNHGTYHRGNIAAMIRQLGHPGVSSDYIVYLRERGREQERKA